jgi:hypothetical protein
MPPRSFLTTTAIVLVLLPVRGMACDQNIELQLRSRINESGNFAILTKEKHWQARETAIIVCGMWDAHHCLDAVRREEEMVPRMKDDK